ncbi:MAG TPA: superoxide dismutase [Planctomycetota bacterium]|nr:superoxide dismutase [Planctomycetota bacterium]
MTRYTLPDLPYDYSALEPHITGHILELHHDKHHRAYVEGANRGIDQLLEARQKGGIERVPTIERALAFNVSGHVLHSIFWQNLAPEGARKPAGELAEAIERDFGSLASLRGQMIELAKTTMGSGWAALVFEPVTRRLGTMQIHDHQSEVTQGSVPLLVLDAWEHAYYLQYETDKEAYFKAIWNVFDWDDVAARYQRAQRTELAISNGASGR